jgi:hypothetical protein
MPHHTLRNLILAGCILALAACTPATPTPAPTQDPGPIRTMIAATIYAKLTQAVTATFTPTATATATNTPLPPTATNTPEPTATIGTIVPTATEPIQGDAAKFLTTAPHQYARIHSNETYNIEFDLLNVGTTTWTAGNYSLVRVGGEPFTNQSVIQLDRDVPPGKKGVFIFGAFGSENMDPHTTYWQLYNSSGIAVPGGYVYFTYIPE